MKRINNLFFNQHLPLGNLQVQDTKARGTKVKGTKAKGTNA